MSETRHEPVARTGTRRLAGGTGIDAHRHDDHQIVYAGRGVLSVATDGGVWIAPATRAIWIPAGTVHRHRAYGPTVLYTVGLPVTVNPLRSHAPAVIAVDPLLRELLIAYAELPETEPRDPRGSRRARLRAVLLDQLRTSQERPLHVPAPRDPRLADLAALLSADPADRRRLALLARQVGSSPRTVSRLCRDELGMTFPQWRTQLRLHLALQLLADGLPVTAVAHRCGWATPSAFIEVFRRTLGHTPGGRTGRGTPGPLSGPPPGPSSPPPRPAPGAATAAAMTAGADGAERDDHHAYRGSAHPDHNGPHGPHDQNDQNAPYGPHGHDGPHPPGVPV